MINYCFPIHVPSVLNSSHVHQCLIEHQIIFLVDDDGGKGSGSKMISKTFCFCEKCKLLFENYEISLAVMVVATNNLTG